MDYFLRALAAALRLIVSLDAGVYYVVWTSLRVAATACLLAAAAGIPLGLTIALMSSLTCPL